MEPSAVTAAHATPSPVRVDAFDLAATFDDVDGTRYRLGAAAPLDARARPALPLDPRWIDGGALHLRASGLCAEPFAAAIAVDGRPLAPATPAEVRDGAFTLDLTVPLSALRDRADGDLKLGLALAPTGRVLLLLHVDLQRVKSLPAIEALDLREATDSILVDAPERKLFDLQNPEEGFWIGTGVWRLRALADWARSDDRWSLDAKPAEVSLTVGATRDPSPVLYEDPARRSGGRRAYTELFLDSSHPSLREAVPPEGVDLPFTLSFTHALTRADAPALTLSWSRALAVRLRDPRPSLPAFRRLSGVGIDFGTTATVAAFTHKGFRSLMRLGSTHDRSANPAENPTVLLVEDHERLWAEMGVDGRRFPNLLRVVQASHAARARSTEFPNAVVSEIKSLPERVMVLDQSPQLRDRERRADFLLDEPRVRALVRAYGYLLGRAINRPGQEVFLRYWLTHPAEFDEASRALLMEELRAGILLSIPEGISADDVTVQMVATEPEAYAAEVCPEVAAHPAFAPLIERFGELRFAVFDFGGGTLDVACGRYRPATPDEEARSGCSTVIETLQVAGDDHLGGDYLTHELTWLVHQHPPHLAEMESKEVPMQRPSTLPENKLARRPELYKRSLAARQNKMRFESELGVERVKFRRENELARVDALTARKVDESEVALESLKSDLPGVQKKLAAHLEERIADGARLLASLLATTQWDPSQPAGEKGWREQGVVILLAGNSSRSEYVERALSRALEMPDLRVWRPGDSEAPQGVVLWETPARLDRGAEIMGVSPKTAVALGALRIASREVHLARAAQRFGYHVGDLRGFPPRFEALLPMGATPTDPASPDARWVDLGAWTDAKPLRVAKEYEPGKMTASDPRVLAIRPELPDGSTGRLRVCAAAPSILAVEFTDAAGGVYRSTLNLAQWFS
ncbi:MAG: hypothetical protein R3A52_11740 [Polyangiales bacterium]